MSQEIQPTSLSEHNNSKVATTLDTTKADIAADLSHTPTTPMNFTDVNYDIVRNHPSGDGELMQTTMENILEPENVVLLTKEQFLEQLQAGQIDYSCIDGRSVANAGKATVHVAGDAYGIYVLAAMQMLADLGVSQDLDDDIVEQFITTNNIKPTSHSGSHSHGDESITTCDCGHCKTNGMELDEYLQAIANKYYENPVQLVGDHKEQAIIISPNTEVIVLVNTTNELQPGDKAHQAERQVFWNDAGAIQVIMEHYADSFAKIIQAVAGQKFESSQIATVWNEAYNMQL